jgi:hypothetical protein
MSLSNQLQVKWVKGMKRRSHTSEHNTPELAPLQACRDRGNRFGNFEAIACIVEGLGLRKKIA